MAFAILYNDKRHEFLTYTTGISYLLHYATVAKIVTSPAYQTAIFDLSSHASPRLDLAVQNSSTLR